ncbi:MAG TPA: class I SAM-dependent methyltransferase, partial [Methanotrichaceae archaeon]|nr:class I SAM-dependent methyltransferase [Methanotrichaceae archaeon]
MECSKIEDVVKNIKYKIVRKRRTEASRPANESQPLDIQANLLSMASSWDIQNRDYQISSHRPIIGDMLTAGRGLVHGEVRRYIDPSMIQQSIFNSTVIDVLGEVDRRLERLTTRMDMVESASVRIDGALAGILEDARKAAAIDHDGFLKVLDDHIEKRLSSSLASLNLDIERKAWLAALLDSGRISKRMESADADSRVGGESCGTDDADSRSDEAGGSGFDYLSFENSNRGSSYEIKKKQGVFLPYFKGCRNVLDIGCGRGEFLELLGENGIGAVGVDQDVEMAIYSRSRGLNVEKADALSYIEKAGD